MSYCNVWAKVVFCGFPKKEMFTQILLCLFSAHHQTVGLFRLVRFASSTGRRRRRKKKKKKKMNNSKSGCF